MPEDQGVNGDRWTNEASRFLVRLNWEKVADSNIDIPGVDGREHGIDAMFTYKLLPNDESEGVFLEAKNYSKDSFKIGMLQDWVNVINQKILDIKRSEEFYKKYPAFINGVKVRNGLLAIWINDLDNDKAFREKFTKALVSISVPRGRLGRINRLFILTNDNILRLCSLIDTIGKLKSTDQSQDNEYYFWYPATNRTSAIYSNVLNLEYMYSKFVFVKVGSKGLRPSDRNVVCYFGARDVQSYSKLRDAMLLYQFVSNNNQLTIYSYQDDKDFRKIKPDVEKLFTDIGSQKVDFCEMNAFSRLPGWIKDEH